MMVHTHTQRYLRRANCHAPTRIAMRGSCSPQGRFSEASHEEEIIPLQWYHETFPKLAKLAHQLQDVGCVRGRLVDIHDESVVADDHVGHEMRTFKLLARSFIGHPSIQQKLRDRFCIAPPNRGTPTAPPFSRSSERQEMILNSLAGISSFLNLSSQSRKVVRKTVSEHVTQHRIWVGALREILSRLNLELESSTRERSRSTNSMGIQIIARCADLLRDHDSPPWVKLEPPASTSRESSSRSSNKWEDVLEMVNDLYAFLRANRAPDHLDKLMAMKEGLCYIKDVSIDRDIAYGDARLRECLVQRRLSVALGHSSRCLFTLLLYYLYGCVSDIEIDLRGDLLPCGQHRSTLYMGCILSSSKERMVRSGIKRLDRALELFKYVWQSSGMDGALILQGHLWCAVGDEDEMISYRGNSFFIHGINL